MYGLSYELELQHHVTRRLPFNTINQKTKPKKLVGRFTRIHPVIVNINWLRQEIDCRLKFL